MPLAQQPPNKRRKKSAQAWLLPSLLIPMILAVLGLQWWQDRASQPHLTVSPSAEPDRTGAQPEASQQEKSLPQGGSLPSSGTSERTRLPAPVPIREGGVQRFTPGATEAPLAAPRQIGNDQRLPESGAVPRSANDAQRHPLCDSLEQQRRAAEERLQAATSASQTRTFTHERDTALQNLKSLGCFN